MRNPLAAFVAGVLLFAAAGMARAQPPDSTDVLIQTSLGDITVALDPAHAPKTVDNFLRYVSEGHYDGTLVYRVVPGFATNTRPVHDPIALEAGNGLSNLRGTIAMARETDPNSATAEFFINLADNTRLDRLPDDSEGSTGYTVFGHVITGMDVADKIAAVPLGPGGPMPGAFPVDPVKIEKVTILGVAPAATPTTAPTSSPTP